MNCDLCNIYFYVCTCDHYYIVECGTLQTPPVWELPGESSAADGSPVVGGGEEKFCAIQMQSVTGAPATSNQKNLHSLQILLSFIINQTHIIWPTVSSVLKVI